MLIESQAVEGVAACLHCSDSVGVGKPSEAVAVIKNSAQINFTCKCASVAAAAATVEGRRYGEAALWRSVACFNG